MMRSRVDPAEVGRLVSALVYLSGMEHVYPDRVGMGGFCVGASMALVAASDSRISEDVKFISSFGAYYDLGDMVKQIRSNRSYYGPFEDPWTPNELPRELLAHQLIGGLETREESEALAEIFIRGPYSDGVEMPSGISQGARAAARILQSVNSSGEDGRMSLQEAEKAVESLPPNIQADLRAVSPSSQIGNLKAKVLIAHDREDDLVPAEESRRLADALSGRRDVLHTEFSFFSHVTPGKRVGPVAFARETYKLLRYAYKAIRLAV